MSQTSKHHNELDPATGAGKCSVPMWMNGCPCGFCDKPAYGRQLPYKYFKDAYTGKRIREDGGYAGYVPALACPAHGGPKAPFLDVVFDAPPGPEAGRFVEVENATGQSVNFGEWVERPDGYWALRIPQPVTE